MSSSPLTFGFKGKVAVFADIWTDIGVCSDVLFQHAGLLTADATLSTYVLAPAPTPHIDIVFIGFITERKREREGEMKEKHGKAIRIYFDIGCVEKFSG